MQTPLVCRCTEALFEKICQVVDAPRLTNRSKRLPRCVFYGLAERASRREAELFCNRGSIASGKFYERNSNHRMNHGDETSRFSNLCFSENTIESCAAASCIRYHALHS